MKLRSQIIPNAYGTVLEVGMGSGLNLSMYDANKVNLVYGLEPSKGMSLKAQQNLDNSPVAVEWLDLPGESIPLADNSVDTLVLTFTLCTIEQWQAALQQMHRVLKPEGVMLFCEHGLADSEAVRRWQHRLNPIWKRVAGGCNLNRPILSSIHTQPFEIIKSESLYIDKALKVAGYVTHGIARKIT